MRAREMSGSSHDEWRPGPDDPGLPDFAAFCTARERFFRGLAEVPARADSDAAPREVRDGSDQSPVAGAGRR